MISNLLSRIRRNHGLEHATIHVLSEKDLKFSAQGNSHHRGFNLNIYGDVDEQTIIAAVEEAFTRMKGGEHTLAVHPNCGTVLLTTATMATLAGQVAFTAEQYRFKNSKNSTLNFLNALPTAILASTIALIAARPIGIHLQREYTVEGDLKEMELLRIRKIKPSPVTYFFKLLLAQGNPMPSTSFLIETIN